MRYVLHSLPLLVRTVTRLPASPSQGEGNFRWWVDPTHSVHADDATWYFDGSLLYGKWKPYRTTGFAVVVVHQGTLIGYGNGSPPHWCNTAAAAEAWALATVLSQCPFVPHMRTDCMSLLRAAEGGQESSTNAKRQLARIWNAIAMSMTRDGLTMHGHC